MSNVSPIPQGFHAVTPRLIIKGAAAAMDFYAQAFAAAELCRFTMPGMDDLIAHGLLKIGDSLVMVSDEFPPEFGCAGVAAPATCGGSTVTLQVYSEDVDAMYRQALAAGCAAVMEPMDTFWGDRYGQVSDPYGHHWALATHIRDMSGDEIAAAAAAEFAAAPAG